MARAPYIRDPFTREIKTGQRAEREHFELFPKDRYDTAVERWADVQRYIEFVMNRKRLLKPKDSGG
jgi:hypothetical protein